MTRIIEVNEYHAANPDNNARQCAEALGVTEAHVYKIASESGFQFPRMRHGRTPAPRQPYKGAAALTLAQRKSVLAMALYNDDPSTRITPRLPALTFLTNRLAGE